MTIDTTNMCSHLQRKLFEEDGAYHRLWLAIQDDPELTAVVRSRQLHIYRNGKKVLVLAGKSAPKVIRKDSICEMLYDTKPMITLIPFQESDREQFILDNQRAFKYGAMEEMTKQREQSQACLSFAESRRNSSEAQFGMRDDRMEEGEEVISRKTIERSIDGEQAETYRIVCDGDVVGGLILQIDKQNAKGDLEILFIKPEAHSKGLGQAAWKAVEAMHPEIRVWETMTPYFEKRNIHFYVNRLGFHIVEFWNKYQHGPAAPDDIEENWSEEDEMFLFRKTIKNS